MSKKNERGFGAVEGLLVLVIVGMIGFVGWYVWHNREAKLLSSPATSAVPHKTTTVSTTPPAPTPSPTPAPTKPTFDFVSSDNWSAINSPSKSFSVSIGDSTTKAFCDNSDVIMVGMLDINYIAGTQNLKCSSLESAIKSTDPIYTYIAFGKVTTEPVIPADAKSYDYTMADGVTTMTRNEYQDTSGQKSYDNVVYVAKKNGGIYVAWRRTEAGNTTIPSDNFVTIVHKTWTIN